MKWNGWLTALALVAGCGFGDNNLARGTSHHACGDGTVDTGEGCDDGNMVSGDGCNSQCAVETSAPVCGNGTRENGEACDDGNKTGGDGCSAACTLEAVCGNGTVEAGEQCDDHNTTSGDGCSPTCQTETATACGLVPQTGCSGATPACDLTDANDGSTECRAVVTQGNSNSHCTDGTGCRAGYTCTVDSAANPGWCSRFCEVDSDCTGTGSRCVNALDDGNGNPLNVDVCSNACDPYGQTGCPSGMGCFPINSADGDYTDCLYMGTTPDGGACTSSRECRNGSGCVTFDGTTHECASFCVFGNNGTCGTGEVCHGFTDPLTIGTVEYGVCGN